MTTNPSRTSPPSTIACRYLPEPLLVFGDGGKHIDPKAGIAAYGPRSYLPERRHPRRVRVGLIGTAYTVEKAHQWLLTNAEGVAGNAKHSEFPGYQADRGFFSSLDFEETWVETISQSELQALLAIRLARERFQAAVDLLEGKLRLLAERDLPPEYVVLGLPDELVQRCGVVDYIDKVAGAVHRDLRRAVKAVAMRHRLPTQLFRQQTMEGRDPDHPSKIAWNYFSGLYFKAGGIPWGPIGLTPDTCYVGISFYRPLGSIPVTLQTSLVQAFDEHGDGLILRGHDFEWDADKEGSRAPHLTEEQAKDLIQLVLTRYQEVMKRIPRRVVVHKTSRYWPKEREGFQAALRDKATFYDLLALESQSTVRLMTPNTYPPLRGTAFSVGELDYLYTTGYIAALQEFHGMHVPAPLQIADHVGQDTPRETLLKEILILSKMNWNAARLGGHLPITLKFSRLVGEILREIPADQDPLPQFKFYM